MAARPGLPVTAATLPSVQHMGNLQCIFYTEEAQLSSSLIPFAWHPGKCGALGPDDGWAVAWGRGCGRPLMPHVSETKID